MKGKFTASGLLALAAVAEREELLCKKAKLYSHTLTDPALASRMRTLAAAHAKRFERLAEMI